MLGLISPLVFIVQKQREKLSKEKQTKKLFVVKVKADSKQLTLDIQSSGFRRLLP